MYDYDKEIEREPFDPQKGAIREGFMDKVCCMSEEEILKDFHRWGMMIEEGEYSRTKLEDTWVAIQEENVEDQHE